MQRRLPRVHEDLPQRRSIYYCDEKLKETGRLLDKKVALKQELKSLKVITFKTAFQEVQKSHPKRELKFTGHKLELVHALKPVDS